MINARIATTRLSTQQMPTWREKTLRHRRGDGEEVEVILVDLFFGFVCLCASSSFRSYRSRNRRREVRLQKKSNPFLLELRWRLHSSFYARKYDFPKLDKKILFKEIIQQIK